jgi:hypothetical protein
MSDDLRVPVEATASGATGTILVYNPVAPTAISLVDQSLSVDGSVRGKTVAIINNGWASYATAAPVLKEELRKRLGVAKILEFKKSHMSAPSSDEIVAECLDRAAAVFTYLGNCGGCTSYSLHDCTTFRKAGRAAMAFVTEMFVPLAEMVARAKGVGQLPLAVLPADFEQSSPKEIAESIRASMDQIIAGLSIKDAETASPAGAVSR